MYTTKLGKFWWFLHLASTIEKHIFTQKTILQLKSKKQSNKYTDALQHTLGLVTINSNYIKMLINNKSITIYTVDVNAYNKVLGKMAIVTSKIMYNIRHLWQPCSIHI